MGTFGGLVWPPPWHGDRNVAMLNRRPEAGGPSYPSYPMARLRTDDPDDAPSTSSAPQAFPTPRPSMTHLRQRVTAFDKRMQREGVYLPRELWERDALRDMGAQGFGVAGDEDGGPTEEVERESPSGSQSRGFETTGTTTEPKSSDALFEKARVPEIPERPES